MKKTSNLNTGFTLVLLFAMLLNPLNDLSGQTLQMFVPPGDALPSQDVTEQQALINLVRGILSVDPRSGGVIAQIDRQESELGRLLSDLGTKDPDLAGELGLAIQTYANSIQSGSDQAIQTMGNTLKVFVQKLESEVAKATASDDAKLKVAIGFTGELKKAITDKGADASTGSLRLRFSKKEFKSNENFGFQLIGMVSAAALNDTIESAHGTSLLNPKTGRNSALIDFHLDYNHNHHYWFLHAYSHLSTTLWKYDPSSAPKDEIYENGSILGGGLLFGWQIFKEKEGEPKNRAAMSLEAGLAYRALFGGLLSNEDLRMHTLGNDERQFWGLEIGFSTAYKGVTAGLSFYYFNGDTTGLTDGRVAGGISVGIDLIEL